MTTYLRFAARHLQRTLSDLVTTQLTTLGWTGPTPPFAATPVTVLSRRLNETDVSTTTGNLVAISFGEETDDQPYELGGGLMITPLVMYADVVAASDPIGLALAGDIKDLLSGRAPGTSRYVPVRDYTNDPAGVVVDGWLTEIISVTRQRPDGAEYKQFWQTVVTETQTYFPWDE